MFKGTAPAQNHDGLALACPTFQVPSLPDDTLILFAVQNISREQLKAAQSCSLSHPACGSCLLERLCMSRLVTIPSVDRSWAGSAGFGEHFVCSASVP